MKKNSDFPIVIIASFIPVVFLILGFVNLSIQDQEQANGFFISSIGSFILVIILAIYILHSEKQKKKNRKKPFYLPILSIEQDSESLLLEIVIELEIKDKKIPLSATYLCENLILNDIKEQMTLKNIHKMKVFVNPLKPEIFEFDIENFLELLERKDLKLELMATYVRK